MNCWRLESKHGPLVSEATTLSLPPLPNLVFFLYAIKNSGQQQANKQDGLSWKLAIISTFSSKSGRFTNSIKNRVFGNYGCNWNIFYYYLLYYKKWSKYYQKWPKYYQKLPKSNHSSFYIRVGFFKIAQNVAINLGYFC